MNPLAQKYGASTLASVNLVPKEIQERRKVRAVQFTAVVAVLIALGVVVLGFLAAVGTQAAAQSGLDDALRRQDEAIDKRDAKAPVYNAYVTREEQEYALAQVGFGEIDYSQFATAIANTASDGNSSFVNLAIHGPSPLGFGGGEQDSLFGSSTGSFEFTVNTVSAAEARLFISRLEHVPGVASVRATAEEFVSDEGAIYWSITGSGVVTPTVLTMRIIPTDSITGVDALTAVATQGSDTPGVAPTPAPSAGPSASPEPTATAGSEG